MKSNSAVVVVEEGGAHLRVGVAVVLANEYGVGHGQQADLQQRHTAAEHFKTICEQTPHHCRALQKCYNRSLVAHAALVAKAQHVGLPRTSQKELRRCGGDEKRGRRGGGCLQVMQNAQAGLEGQAVPQRSEPLVRGLERRDVAAAVVADGGRAGRWLRHGGGGGGGGSFGLLGIERCAGGGGSVLGRGADVVQRFEILGFGYDLEQNAGVALVPDCWRE